MARYKFSEMMQSIKRKSGLEKWVAEHKQQARESAYQNRNTIYKRELEEEMNHLDILIDIWDRFKKLRKKSPDYDVLIKIDKQGYISIQMTFPITQKEFDEASDNRWKKIEQLGKSYACCVRMYEQVYEVTHGRIEKLFSGIPMNAHGGYDKYENALVRIVDIC